MVLVPAREEVRREQALLRQPRPVGAAPDQAAHRLEPDAADRLLGPLHDLRPLRERVLHVAVLDLGLEIELGALLGGGDVLDDPAQPEDVLLEQGVVVIADDELDRRLGIGAAKLVRVGEPLALLRRFGRPLVPGSRASTCAASLSAFTSSSFAVPGWIERPVILSVTFAAENVSSWISPAVEPSSVYAASAPNRSRSKKSVPRPTSSSGLKPTLTGPCGISGCATRCATAAMISATPALSSAPSSVVPSVVISSWPSGREVGAVLDPDHLPVHPRQDDLAAVVDDPLRPTSAPVTDGLVSTWARKPTVGTSSSTVAGTVAKT